MKQYRSIIFIVIMAVLVACRPTQSDMPSQSLPTLARIPTLTAAVPLASSPSGMPSPYPSWTPTHTLTASATATITSTPLTVTALAALPTDTRTPVISPTFTPTATPLPRQFIFGQSVEGRDLIAFRHGTGEHIIMLVGGIHAGFEANTIDLIQEIRTHLQDNPAMIDPTVTFLLIPALNPDGAAQGRTLAGRFNGNGVDLNRNWGCGWSPNAVFRDTPVDAGTQAFSEPETTALGSLIQRSNPEVVIFYHSAANGVYAGECENSESASADLAVLYGEISGYPTGEEFTAYTVTGSAPAWVSSLGISTLDVELASAQVTEFDRNWRAINALQAWVQSQS